MSQGVYQGWKFPSAKVGPPNERYAKLITCPETTGYESATVLLSYVPVGSTTGMHTHPDSDEIIHCVGRGEGIVDGEKTKVETDSVIVAPKGVEHECRNISDTETLKLFCVFLPPIKLNEVQTQLAQKTKKYLGSK